MAKRVQKEKPVINSKRVSSEIISLLNKTMKNEVAFDLSELSEDKNIKGWIPTGSRLLDNIFSDKPNTGGIPLGRIIEIFGPESTGKSLLAYSIGAKCQQMGGIVIYFDVEQVFSKDMASVVGLDISGDKFIYSDTLVVEDIFEMIETLVTHFSKSKDLSQIPVVVVWDSIAQTMSRKELDGEFDDETPAMAARAIGRSLKKIMPVFKTSNIAFVFINQERDKMNVRSFGGEKSGTPGGRIVKYAASIRARVSKLATIKNDAKIDPMERPIGIRIICETKKNKVASPFRTSEYDIYFARGIEDYEYSWEQISKLGKGKYYKKSGNNLVYVNEHGEELEFKRSEFVAEMQQNLVFRNRIYDCLEEFRTNGGIKQSDDDEELPDDIDIVTDSSPDDV